MENIPVLYVLFVLLGCLLAIIAVWSRRSLKIRAGAVILLLVLMGLNYSALVNLLGRPQPIDSIAKANFEGDSVVLAATVEEGNAIYLWLRHPNQRKPSYYSMDWDHESAVALKQAMAIITKRQHHRDDETKLRAITGKKSGAIILRTTT